MTMSNSSKSASSRYRAKMKEENPERYKAYLEKERIRQRMKKIRNLQRMNREKKILHNADWMTMSNSSKTASRRYRAKMKENPERYKAYLEKARVRQRMKKNRKCQQVNMEKKISHNAVGRKKLNMIHIIQSMATRIPVLKLRRIDETEEQPVPLTEDMVNGSVINITQDFRKECEICEITFLSKSSFDTHLQECVKMKSETPPTYLDMVEHREVTNGFEEYIKTVAVISFCPVCLKQFMSLFKMQEHLESHNILAPYLCANCNKTYQERKKYFRHIKQHRKILFQCTICNNTSLSRQHINNHVRRHLGIRPFACKLCHKTYLTKAHLSEHVVTHLGYKPFQCDFCGKGFYIAYRLNSHKRNMHNIYSDIPR